MRRVTNAFYSLIKRGGGRSRTTLEGLIERKVHSENLVFN